MLVHSFPLSAPSLLLSICLPFLPLLFFIVDSSGSSYSEKKSLGEGVDKVEEEVQEIGCDLEGMEPTPNKHRLIGT